MTRIAPNHLQIKCFCRPRTAIYVRVSTVHADAAEVQRARLRAAVSGRGGIIVAEYEDRGHAGGRGPGFQALLRDTVDKRFDSVLVTDLSRLSRSLIDFYELVGILDEHGIGLVSLKENFDTATAQSRAMLNIILVFAELERQQTAERTRALSDGRVPDPSGS